MGLSNAERQARWQQRRKQRLAELEKRLAAYEREHSPTTAQPAADPQEVERIRAELMQTRAELTQAKKELEQAHKRVAASAFDDAAKDREIERLRKLNAQLQSEIVRALARAIDADQLKERLAALERERAAWSRGAASRGAVVGRGEDTKLKKLIRRLDSPSDNEAAGALRALARELQARGRGFQELGDLTAQWDQEDAVVRPPKPKPVDWTEVENTVKTYTEGKTKVTINTVLKAVYAHMPKEQQAEFRGQSARVNFIDGYLGRLGFRRRGEMTYERTG
jgi:DNA repair exonuclease SbcCD ATPase subunit